MILKPRLPGLRLATRLFFIALGRVFYLLMYLPNGLIASSIIDREAQIGQIKNELFLRHCVTCFKSPALFFFIAL